LDDLLLVADDAVLVQEASIIAGMRMLLDHAGLVVEPSAALGSVRLPSTRLDHDVRDRRRLSVLAATVTSLLRGRYITRPRQRQERQC
jgi:threonine dehydratase